MRYLVCTDHRPTHLTCRAPWLAHMLKLKRHRAECREGIVTTDAPATIVNKIAECRPARASSVFASCAA